MEKIKSIYLVIAFILILIVGTAGYYFIESWNLLDSFFMTVITITTVGYREIGGNLSDPGKIFTTFLIFSGFGIAALALSHLTSMIIKGEFNNIWGKFRMENEIKKMKDHFVIAGYGRTGQVICSHLTEKKIPFVIIDTDGEMLNKLSEKGIPTVHGDAADEEMLLHAGIQRAKGFVAVVSSDANNAFAIMTAKGLNPNLNIIARALDSQNIRKLKSAGAHRVIAPYVLGGLRIAQAVANPNVADFIDIVEDVRAKHIELADVLIHGSSDLVGKSLSSENIRSANIIIIGIKRSGGSFEFQPKGQTVIQEKDHLILMGPSEGISKIREFSV